MRQFSHMALDDGAIHVLPVGRIRGVEVLPHGNESPDGHALNIPPDQWAIDLRHAAHPPACGSRPSASGLWVASPRRDTSAAPTPVRSRSPALACCREAYLNSGTGS